MNQNICWIVLVMLLAFFQSEAQIIKKDMNTKSNYSVEIIRYKIAADQYIAFEEAYQKASVHLEASPFCLGYHLLHGNDEPDHYIVTIYWTSKDDHLTKFRSSESFRQFLPLVRPFFNDILEMKHYDQTGIHWQREQ